MQRPTTTGRRHIRAGSITVAELIKNQPSPIRIPSPRAETATDGPASGLHTDESTESGKSGSTRMAKAAGLVTGALVLFASVAAASILAGNHPTESARPHMETPIEISGSAALRPDLLSAQLREDLVLPDRQDQVRPVHTTPVAPVAADPKANPDMASPPAVASSVAIDPQPKIDVVRRFFELLPTQPETASHLLSADLLGGSIGDFVQSWSTIRLISIDSTSLRPDGSVLAVVSMQESDGGWLHIEQLFRLTDTSVPRIVGTEVRSAQRS